MTCEHLIGFEQAMIAEGYTETFRGKAWSQNVREWVYFDVCFDRPAVRDFFEFDPCVVDHEHLGTHDGQEAGFVCTIHQDGVMGIHPKFRTDYNVYPRVIPFSAPPGLA
jgi:hypothetical protein